MNTRPGHFSDLRTRLLSAAVLGGLALSLLWLGGGWSAALIAAIAAAMAWEWRSVTAAEGKGPGALGVIAAMVCGGAVAITWYLGASMGLGLLVLGAATVAARDLAVAHRATALWSFAGIVLVGGASIALLALRAMEQHGLLTALWVVIVVAATDTGGYFAGRMIGGPKLWPSVSPKKTWAGLGGGIALAFASGGLFSWATTGTYYHEVCTVSAVAALLAQSGDLAQSAMKRRFGVKDAGSIIPGHGGALDRFDGLMAATLVAAAVTFWRGKTVFIW
ncbi:MAG: phosphatidate cytidylyltransferase [Pseudomonadota bacterium]